MTIPATTIDKPAIATAAPALPGGTNGTAPAAPSPPPAEVAAEPAAPSDGAGSAAAPAEPAPEEPPKTADPLADAKATLERARAGAKKAKQWREAQAAHQRELDALRRERDEAARQAQWAQRLQELGRKDRMALARELGISPKELAGEAAREGTPEAAMEAVRRELAEERSARQKLEQQIQAREQAQRWDSVVEAFHEEAAKADSYPNLKGVNPDFILAAATSVIHQLKQNPATARFVYSDAEVLEYLNQHWAKSESASPSPKAASPAPNGPAQRNGSATSRPLTNGSAAKGSSLPANFGDLSDQEQVRLMAKALMESGAISEKKEP